MQLEAKLDSDGAVVEVLAEALDGAGRLQCSITARTADLVVDDVFWWRRDDLGRETELGRAIGSWPVGSGWQTSTDRWSYDDSARRATRTRYEPVDGPATRVERIERDEGGVEVARETDWDADGAIDERWTLIRDEDRRHDREETRRGNELVGLEERWYDEAGRLTRRETAPSSDRINGWDIEYGPNGLIRSESADWNGDGAPDCEASYEYEGTGCPYFSPEAPTLDPEIMPRPIAHLCEWGWLLID